jgi:pseudaminic acid cytidylyltransferase
LVFIEKMKSAIAIIPARGGSKRIHRKNIRDFCGKPMIVWSIEAAQNSGIFDRVIVSTDDPEIRSIAIGAGAEVPFERPSELANDHAGTIPVIRHAVQWITAREGLMDSYCCIYATAPFLKSYYLSKGYELLNSDSSNDFVFAATPFDFPIFRALRLGKGNEVSMYWPEHEASRSQDLPAAYHDAGQFYWGTAHAWLNKDHIFSANSRAIIIPPHLVQDIDTPEDWLQAELKFQALKNA